MCVAASIRNMALFAALLFFLETSVMAYNGTVVLVNTTKPTHNRTEPKLNTTQLKLNTTQPNLNTTQPKFNVTKPQYNATKKPSKPKLNATKPSPSVSERKPNVIMITMDQLRFDVVRYMQDILPDYDGHVKVMTPNLDHLAANGAVFTTAYCMYPSCAPARTALKTGFTSVHSGMEDNSFVRGKAGSMIDVVKERIDQLVSFEQILVEKLNYTAAFAGK